MTVSLKDVPVRFPDKYDPAWFQTYHREILNNADVRFAVGVGVQITTNGDSKATLTNAAGISSILTATNESASLPYSRRFVTTAELTGTDGGAGNTYSLSVTVNGITLAMMAQAPACTVLANATNGTANVTYLAAGADDLPLRRNGGTLAFGMIPEASVTNLVSDLAAKVPTSRTISTTSPLSGGGALSGDLTLSIPLITSGTGAPATSPADGTLYIRTDGGDSTTLYARIGGAWKVATFA